ncbi:MAG: sensor histidine kinase [Anaerolineales bacterium]|nr:sensor histidine kinase [Anaerolineales bacterium]
MRKIRDTESFDPERGTRALAVGLWALGIALWVGSFAYVDPVREYLGTGPQLSNLEQTFQSVLSSATMLALTTMGLFIVLRGASRRFGWIMLVAGFLFNLDAFTTYYGAYAILVRPQADLPFGQFAAWIQNLWVIGLSMLFIYMPLLFPTGELPSSRWRPVLWAISIFLFLFVLVLAFADLPLTNIFLEADTPVHNPYGLINVDFISEWAGQTVIVVTGFLFAASLLAALSSLVFRWRGADQETRQQIKWLLYAFGVLIALRLVGWLGGGLYGSTTWYQRYEAYLRYGEQVAVIGLVLALGIAVLKYRLYDIDLIINRTLVYGALTAIVAGAYVVIVTALAQVLPADGGLLPPLFATGVIAALFAPLRDRLQRGVNRVMFGERDEPYKVLSQLGRGLSRAGPPGEILDTVVETIGGALKLPYVAVQLQQKGVYKTRAEFGDRSNVNPSEQVAFSLTHQNERVGQIVVAPRSPGGELAPKDRQLLEDIAHQVGAVAHAVRVTAALRVSRQRLVTAREEERRRLRRDLHDGLGPTLASQTLRLDTAMDLVREDPEAALEQLAGLHQQTQEIVADIRRLVHQLRPPVLDDLGLIGAVRAQLRRNHRGDQRMRFSVESEPEGLPKLPAAVEVAAYRITMEAVTNVVRHAGARRCDIRFSLEEGDDHRILRIQVSDDGQGLPEHLEYGVGLASMRERADELGGRLTVENRESGGTRVWAELPLLEGIQS